MQRYLRVWQRTDIKKLQFQLMTELKIILVTVGDYSNDSERFVSQSVLEKQLRPMSTSGPLYTM